MTAVAVPDREREVDGDEQRAPSAQNCRMCQRSWASSRPVTGLADRITNPTVIAVRLSRGISHVSPRGALSKIIAPSRTVGSWNVSSPSTRPISVFGDVQTNPSQAASRTVRHRADRRGREGKLGPPWPTRPLPAPGSTCRRSREELGERFADAGHELYLVGGSVRDLMLARTLARPRLRDDAAPRRDDAGRARLGRPSLPRRREVRHRRALEGRRAARDHDVPPGGLRARSTASRR